MRAGLIRRTAALASSAINFPLVEERLGNASFRTEVEGERGEARQRLVLSHSEGIRTTPRAPPLSLVLSPFGKSLQLARLRIRNRLISARKDELVFGASLWAALGEPDLRDAGYPLPFYPRRHGRWQQKWVG